MIPLRLPTYGIGQAAYEGIIRKNPIDKREFVAVGYEAGNPGHGGDISKDDLGEMQVDSADLLFFSGDQCDHKLLRRLATVRSVTR